MDVVPFDAPADAACARIRACLERRGLVISSNDLLIAAHAVALGMTLVSDNLREFGRVKGHSVTNWL